MPAEVIDGNDVLVVAEAVGRAADRARSGDGPTVLEAQTYRHFGHSRTDPATYRPASELEEWLGRDPLSVARRRLSELGVSEDEVAAVTARAEQIVADAVAEARSADAADPAEAFTDVWADGGYQWRT
jgi:pyruvate dehydrogenase E1 component alpha subunit